jgi:signal transduction histidine kinase
VFESDAKQTCELKLVKNDASLLYAYLEGIAMRDGEGNVKQCQIAVVDIAKRKHAEAEQVRLKDELFHARNLASVGKLAGGVAHNFNNLLTVVMGYASLLMTELKDDNPLREYAQKIINSSQIATNLIQYLLAFSRKQPMNPQAVNLNEVVKAYEALLAKLIREDIKLKIMLSNEDCIVTVDSYQIGNVLMNLAANAQDAIPEEGLLTISTEVVEMDNAFIKAHGFGGTEKYVLVSVSETGVGMDESTRLRVFEPFFTTKEVGKCTGLASVWDSKTAQWLYRC